MLVNLGQKYYELMMRYVIADDSYHYPLAYRHYSRYCYMQGISNMEGAKI